MTRLTLALILTPLAVGTLLLLAGLWLRRQDRLRQPLDEPCSDFTEPRKTAPFPIEREGTC